MSLRPAGSDGSRTAVGGLFELATGIEAAFLAFVRAYSLRLLRCSLVVVFVWFGLLTMAGVNGIAGLVAGSVPIVPASAVDPLLGGWEIAIGLALLWRRTVRLAVALMMAYVAVIMLPLALFPGETFSYFPYGPSFEGVYILKDWVLLGGAMTVGGLLEEDG